MNTQSNRTNGVARVDPRQNIERTRSELFGYLKDGRNYDNGDGELDHQGGTDEDRERGPRNSNSLDWAYLMQTGISAWWKEHPLRAGTMLVTPTIERFAKRKPLQTVAIAAAVGAALIVVRPWRLVSMSAIALSLYRSSNIAGMASSLLDTASHSLYREKHDDKVYR